MALGSTQPLTEMSIRNLPGGKGRPARKADMWEPRRLTTLCPPRPVTGIVLLLRGRKLSSENHNIRTEFMYFVVLTA
jgi:hypothetical protein